MCFSFKWKEASADQIMVSKLKCVFDLADEQIPEVVFFELMINIKHMKRPVTERCRWWKYCTVVFVFRAAALRIGGHFRNLYR